MTLIAKIEVDCKEAEQKLSQASKKSQYWLHDMETQRETMVFSYNIGPTQHRNKN